MLFGDPADLEARAARLIDRLGENVRPILSDLVQQIHGLAREQRATMAMVALIQATDDFSFDAEKIARRAYELADAMDVVSQEDA
jgi:hypothetical protein